MEYELYASNAKTSRTVKIFKVGNGEDDFRCCWLTIREHGQTFCIYNYCFVWIKDNIEQRFFFVIFFYQILHNQMTTAILEIYLSS